MTATDSNATLREVLAELRALRIRIDRQIALVRSALRPATRPAVKGRPRRRAKSAPKSPVKVGKRAARKRPTGYVKERQALETRKKKTRR